MTRNNKMMQKFREEAEEHFSSFEGPEDDNFINDDDDHFDGDDEDSYEGEDEDFYSGPVRLDRMDPNDRTLSFSIENTTNGLLVAELFGAFKNLNNGTNFGNVAGITVSLGESSYHQFLQETISSPHLIKGLRYFVENEIQFANTIEMVEESAAGTVTIRKYQPGTKIDPRWQKNNILVDNGFTFPVTGKHSLKIPINANEKITLIMNIGTRVDQGKTLSGRPVLEVGKKKKKRIQPGK